MSCVIDLASRRRAPSASQRLSHPAGVVLPFDGASDADLLVPTVRRAICAGTYSADMIRLLPDAVHPGDRVLVIGAGVGIVSTLVAQCRGIERVLALEANTALIPYLERVHALNGVPWIETLNAVPATGKRGRVPFFAHRDVRASLPVPERADWQQVMMVPQVDLSLILAEEEISLIICEVPAAFARLVGDVDLGPVERIAVTSESSDSQARDEAEMVVLLAQRGYAVASAEAALMFDCQPRVAHCSLPSVLPARGTGT